MERQIEPAPSSCTDSPKGRGHRAVKRKQLPDDFTWDMREEEPREQSVSQLEFLRRQNGILKDRLDESEKKVDAAQTKIQDLERTILKGLPNILGKFQTLFGRYQQLLETAGTQPAPIQSPVRVRQPQTPPSTPLPPPSTPLPPPSTPSSLAEKPAGPIDRTQVLSDILDPVKVEKAMLAKIMGLLNIFDAVKREIYRDILVGIFNGKITNMFGFQLIGETNPKELNQLRGFSGILAPVSSGFFL
ncbi:hypothetical protein BSL78_22454 [Apostichopus japonicus]|uniref:Uncharacterized protein n=1 Tax=Stichopus japonicus TaxID=307972 RepID=A0A2G8JYA2_STIJA|nr:hypothetical protein BSL78_22454 [Apostichopus japonicus]